MVKRVETIAFVSIVVVALVLGFQKLMPAQSSAARQVMSLPISGYLAAADQDRVIDTLRAHAPSLSRQT